MKKFIFKSIYFVGYFIIFFALVNALFLGIIVSTDFDFRKRIESIKFENPDFELLALGASLGLDGIDAELLTDLGVKSYNLSIGGSSIKTNYFQLKEYLTICSKKPKTVILCLSSYLDTFNDPNDEVIHPIVEFTMKDYKFGLNDLPILKFKWLGFEFLKKLVSSTHRKAELSYGQLKFQKTISDHTSFNNAPLVLENFTSAHWIEELANLCNQNGIELIVLDMPGYNEARNLDEIGPYTLVFDNGDSAKLYNFRSKEFCEIFDADKDWVGNSHLNEFGAEKFTGELYRVLTENVSSNHTNLETSLHPEGKE